MARHAPAPEHPDGDERIAWFVAVATIPAAVIGAVEDAIAENLGEPWRIAIFLAVFGLVLG